MDHPAAACGFMFEEKSLPHVQDTAWQVQVPAAAVGWTCPRRRVLLKINAHRAENAMNMVVMLMTLAAIPLTETFGMLVLMAWVLFIHAADRAFRRWARSHLREWRRYVLADWSGRRRDG